LGLFRLSRISVAGLDAKGKDILRILCVY